MRIDSQNNKILSWLQSGQTLTPIDALKMFGCFRLSGRIHFLKSKGYDIKSNIVEMNDKKFAEYSL
jgi:hypothetical protein